MPSQKRRTTSKSGGSAKSPKKATSGQAKNSSAPATASFDQVFGTTQEKSEERLRLEKLQIAALERLSQLENTTRPTMALYRIRHDQKISRERKHLQRIQEALKALWIEEHKGIPPDGLTDTF